MACASAREQSFCLLRFFLAVNQFLKLDKRPEILYPYHGLWISGKFKHYESSDTMIKSRFSTELKEGIEWIRTPPMYRYANVRKPVFDGKGSPPSVGGDEFGHAW